MQKTAKCSLIMAAATGVLASVAASAGAQTAEPMQPHAMQPRAIADSTFAAALAVNDLANEIRRGTLSPRSHDAPTVRQAVEQLAGFRAQQKRPEFLDNVPLWDFALDALTFEAVNDSTLIVRARARFALDSASQQSVVLAVRRRGTEWQVVNYGRLREYFIEQRERVDRGARK